jgi:hypothetical protein
MYSRFLKTNPLLFQQGKNRLENPVRTALEIIEVQSGNYLGEDDIKRFDDVYGRKI